MRAFEWSDWLRLLGIIGLALGAYSTSTRRPVPMRFNGKRYYPGPDGSFYSYWGMRVKNKAVIDALTERAKTAQGKKTA
jgi:hypothetical protein